ncbi:hypothetical protein CHS0354_039960 [Potamilus streckersoni]|uniref:carbonic anhydrase n=1 Tax=Potamilus streckersoni TaxID=2493646 RepID=A0AAE0T2X2_9BIVA|nr:hypothetical protein CHS0354_039960 [Potamilus streckersoni]
MSQFFAILLPLYVHWTFGGAGNEWGYEGEIGPSNWHNNYPHCAGSRQSPVSIRMNEVIVDSNWLGPFTMRGYDTRDNVCMHLENTGYTVQVNIQGEPISITGGGLKDTYLVEQFHFHWGRLDQRGSEHDIDGIHSPMEMHIVHYNAKYKNFSEALDKSDGIVVLAFLFEVGNHNDHLDHIISHFEEIPYRDNHTLIEPFALREFLPKKLDIYCRYSGSLTTPPCYESVTWFIFYETIEISEEQLHSFRQDVHQNFDNGTITDISDDFRPPQPLYKRKIYCSKKEDD